MADSIHSVRKTLRLMPGEAKELSEKAAAAGMCEADYLRLLITQKPNDYPEIRINQITRNYNSKLYRTEDRELLCAYMKKLNLTVRETADKIGSM